MKKLFIILLFLMAAVPAFAQNTGALLPDVWPVYPLANGSGPLANGFLCTTSSGGVTPLATYRDSALTTANQNPIRLNSAGRPTNGNTEVSVFMQAASYRITVYAAGTGNTCNGTTVGSVLRTVDNVYDYGQFVQNIGSGTVNTIAKWGTTHSLTDSQTTDNGLVITTLPSDGRLDQTSWSQSLWRLSRLQNSASNQFTMNIQTVDNVNSGASGDYEKAGLLIQTLTADPSGATSRDMVGLDTRCTIWSTITTGRCWGGISIATITTGGDGYALAHEFAVDNSGSNQVNVDQTTSKYGLHIVAGQTPGASTPSTAAIFINSNYGSWNNGIVAKQGAFAGSTANNSFINLLKAAAATPIFRIKTTGQTLIGDLPNYASTNDYAATAYGLLTVREFLTVASTANNNKNIFEIFADSSLSRMRLASGHYDTLSSSWPIDLEIGNQNPAGTTPLLEFALEGGVHFKYNASAASSCAVGESVLRNNNGTLELCNNGGGFSVIAAALTSGITGSGTTTYIPRWNGATSLTNSGLVEYTSGGSSTLVYNTTTTQDPSLTLMELYARTAGTVYSMVRNDDTGTVSGAAVGARSGTSTTTNDIFMGVTSSGFTPVTPLRASEGWIIAGATTTGGFGLYVKAGSADYAINGSAIDYTMTADHAFAFIASSTAAVSAAGTARLRNNAGQLQVSNNGGAWANLPGAGGVGVGGSGTQNLISKWQASGTDITNSQIFDNGTQVTVGPLTTSGTPTNDRFLVEYDQPTATYGKVVNATSGTAGQAAWLASVPSNSMQMGVTSALFTTVNGIVAQKGYIAAATTNGMAIQTSAGGIDFIVAGTTINAKLTSDNAFELSTTSTAANASGAAVRLRSNAGVLQVSEGGGAATWTNVLGGGGVSGSGTVNLVPKFSAATTLANSQIFDDGTSTSVGTQAATDDPTTLRLEVRKDQNATSAILMRNNTSGTVAVASVAARSGSANLDITITATSATYTTASGVPASAGLLYSGTDATAGLYLKSGAGSIHFQAATNADNCTLSSAGAMTCTSFVGVGAGLTSVNAASLAGIVPIANGGTNSSTQTNTGIAYYNGASIVTSSNLTYSTNVNFTGGNFNVVTSGQGITFANGSSSVSGNAGQVDIYPGGANRLRVDSTATNGVCIYIGGSLQRLVLSGSTVQVSGAC